VFQFTRPAWGATCLCFYRIIRRYVSIHAPRVGRDPCAQAFRFFLFVSIHAPRVGRDFSALKVGFTLSGFQFTRPAWGATRSGSPEHPALQFQFTRPAWGATQRLSGNEPADVFQFTRPAWGATGGIHGGAQGACFNSRAPRGARLIRLRSRRRRWCFNSRAPRGARRARGDFRGAGAGFNSRAPRGARRATRPGSARRRWFQFTRPAWGATHLLTLGFWRFHVSIHAPRVGRDRFPAG